MLNIFRCTSTVYPLTVSTNSSACSPMVKQVFQLLSVQSSVLISYRSHDLIDINFSVRRRCVHQIYTVAKRCSRYDFSVKERTILIFNLITQNEVSMATLHVSLVSPVCEISIFTYTYLACSSSVEQYW